MQMKDFALRYCKMGLSVIPINPRNKRPLIKFADEPSLTAERIEEIWTEFPTANIALKTDKFFVIDIDVHGDEDGYESLKNWKHVNLITPTLQAKTASGGKHLFYLKREDMPLTQMCPWLKGVDVKAHDNNYVLVAPSATDKGVYEWDLEKSPPGGTMVTASKELVKAMKAEKKQSSGLKELYFQSRSQGGKTKTTELFEIVLKGWGDVGGRNAKCASFIGGLLLRGVDEEDAYNLAKLANDNSLEPLPDKELERTVESMINKDRRK